MGKSQSTQKLRIRDTFDATLNDAAARMQELFPQSIRHPDDAKMLFLRRGDHISGFLHPETLEFFDLHESSDRKHLIIGKHSFGFVRDALFSRERYEVGVGVEREGITSHSQHSMDLCDGDSVNVGVLHVPSAELGNPVSEMLYSALYKPKSWHYMYATAPEIDLRLSALINRPQFHGRLLVFYLNGLNQLLRPIQEYLFIIDENQNIVRIKVELPDQSNTECYVWMLIESPDRVYQSRQFLLRGKLDFVRLYGHCNVAEWSEYMTQRHPPRATGLSSAPEERVLEVIEDEDRHIKASLSPQQILFDLCGRDTEKLREYDDLSMRFKDLYGIDRSPKQIEQDVKEYMVRERLVEQTKEVHEEHMLETIASTTKQLPTRVTRTRISLDPRTSGDVVRVRTSTGGTTTSQGGTITRTAGVTTTETRSKRITVGHTATSPSREQASPQESTQR